MRGRPRLEKHIQSDIVRLLSACGFAVYVLGTRRRAGDYPGTNQTPGIPDLYAIGRTRALWVEVKAARGRLSEAQRIFATLCASAGIPHVVGGLDDVIGWLIQHDIVKPSQVAAYRLPGA